MNRVQLLTSPVIFVSGYGIWNIDNHFCHFLTDTKRSIGMPWSFVLELHGWWHIFTGIGAYIFIALVEYLTSDEAGQPLGGRFAWPVGLIVDCGAGMKDTTGEHEALLSGAEIAEPINGHALDGGNGCAMPKNNGLNGKKGI
jgi:dihydroceramidase